MKSLRAFVLCVSLLATIAAATETALLPEEFKGNTGFVIARVLTNSSTTDRFNGIFFNQWESVVLTDEKGEEHALTLDHSGGRNSTQIFVGLLAPGKYSLQRLVSPRIARRTIANVREGISFDIKANHVTSLGTLIYQPIGNHEYSILHEQHDGPLLALIKANYPKIDLAAVNNPLLQIAAVPAGGIGGQAVGSRTIVVSNSATTAVVGTLTLGIIQHLIDKASNTDLMKAWVEEKDPFRRLEMARQSTYAFNSPIQLPSGVLLAGSNLGQVLMRKKDGEWLRMGTNDSREVTALFAADSNTIVIGGEEGFMRLTNDFGKTWVELPSPGLGLILNIASVNDEYFVLSLQKNDAIVYQTKDLRKGPWNEIRREPNARLGISGPVQFPNLGAASAVQASNRYMFVTETGVFHALNLPDRTWTIGKMLSAPGNTPSRYALRAHADGFVYATGLRAALVSGDSGTTWKEESTACMRMMSFWYGKNKTGYSLCFQGAFVVSTAIYKAAPNTDTWNTLMDETPSLANVFFASDIDDLLLFVSVEGLIHVSTDGGQTWNLERKTF